MSGVQPVGALSLNAQIKIPPAPKSISSWVLKKNTYPLPKTPCPYRFCPFDLCGAPSQSSALSAGRAGETRQEKRI